MKHIAFASAVAALFGVAFWQHWILPVYAMVVFGWISIADLDEFERKHVGHHGTDDGTIRRTQSADQAAHDGSSFGPYGDARHEAF